MAVPIPDRVPERVPCVEVVAGVEPFAVVLPVVEAVQSDPGRPGWRGVPKRFGYYVGCNGWIAPYEFIRGLGAWSVQRITWLD